MGLVIPHENCWPYRSAECGYHDSAEWRINLTPDRETIHAHLFPRHDRAAVSGDYFGVQASCPHGRFGGFTLSGVAYPPSEFVKVPQWEQWCTTGAALCCYRRATPEEPNTLLVASRLRVIDLICEGSIGGPNAVVTSPPECEWHPPQ